jgi:hypothetical protein
MTLEFPCSTGACANIQRRCKFVVAIDYIRYGYIMAA